MAERETPGQRIRNLREAAFITQKDFAERIGVAPSQLSRIESGETKTISSDILIICWGCPHFKSRATLT